MKKVFTLIFVFMMIVSLFVSCNDGEEGLFQMAANSVKKESFKILNIINKESDKVYIVATDNGIAKYNIETKNFSDFVGNGVMATNAIWANNDGSEFIYYDTEAKAYINEKGEEETIEYLADKIPQPLYSLNGEEFTYVFKDKDNKFYSLYTTALDKNQFLSINPLEVKIDDKTIKNVSIIGNGMLRVITNDNEAYFYDPVSTVEPLKQYQRIDTTTLPQGFSDSSLFITVDGIIYRYNNNSASTEIAKTDTSIAKRPAIFVYYDGTNEYTYFIPEGSSSIFEIKDDGSKVTKATKTVTGLQNITVIAILDKKDTNKLVVLTANNGVQELEMK